MTEVTYSERLFTYKERWSGSDANICLAMTAETSFLLFPDSLSPRGSLEAEVNVEQS